jgi:hypothetical protein
MKIKFDWGTTFKLWWQIYTNRCGLKKNTHNKVNIKPVPTEKHIYKHSQIVGQTDRWTKRQNAKEGKVFFSFTRKRENKNWIEKWKCKVMKRKLFNLKINAKPRPDKFYKVLINFTLSLERNCSKISKKYLFIFWVCGRICAKPISNQQLH